MRTYRYIVGNTAGDAIDRICLVRAESIAAGQAIVETETGKDSTRVVNEDTIPDHLLSVADNGGQLEVSEGDAPAEVDPIDKYNLRSIYNKIIAGQQPSPSEAAVYAAALGQQALRALQRTADWPVAAAMIDLRDKLIANTITDEERDDALQALLEIFVGPAS